MTWRSRCTGSQRIGTSESSALELIRYCLTLKIRQTTSSVKMTFCSLILVRC